MVSKRCVVLYAALALGAILVILGALALTLVPSIIRSQVVQRDFLGYDDVNETKLNEMTEQWLVPPYAMQIQIWLYSLSNKNETLDGGKPRLQEIGPFTFTEKQEKTSYRFTHNNTRILYRNMHYYYFNRNLSVSDLSAQVLIPNIVYQKILDFSTNASPFLVEALEFLLREIKYDSPFIQVSVGDALFNGYKDPLIDKICSYALLKPLCADVLKVPDRIGFFNTVNATDDGEYEVDTGLANPLNIGHVYSWNNQTSLDKCWSSHFAAMINGSDGQLFPPLLQKDQTVTLFASQIFRSVNMVAADDSLYAGIPTLRFRSPANANDPSIPDNQGFCNKNATPTFFNKSVQIPGCLPAGLLDFGRCQPSSPRVYLSQAHFLNSPREVRDVFESYPEPLEDNDDTFVDIEPTSGVPLHAKKVMQINIGMITGKLRATAKMRNMIMPLLWINETVYADEGTLKQLGGMVAIRHYAFLGGIAALTLGSIFFVAFISIFVVHTYCQNRTEESELLINEEEHHARTDGDDEVPFD